MLSKLKRYDWLIVFLLILFVVISCFLVFSATVDIAKYGPNFWKKIPVNAAIGFVVFFAVSLVDFRLLIKAAPYGYITGVLLLAALFVWGTEREGAVGWFSLPFIGDFQPAELMKVLLIIAIAAYAARKKGERLEFIRDVVPIGLIVFLPFLLVLVQPDLGNAMIFLVILLGMYWISNVKYTHVLIGTALVVALVGGFVYTFKVYHEDIVKMAGTKYDHWVDRIDTFIDPDNVDPAVSGYQYLRSKIAIGSGGLRGDGYLQGNSVHNNFVPVAYTDGIFVVVAEEFGFIGSSALLLLYFILIYRMILISIQSTNLAGSYMIVGIVSMYVFQIFQNIGMFLGLMPLTGITLPFVSYGGTSLLINMLSLGLVMSVKLHQEKESMFSPVE
ncbi:MAG: rod shape-determining protein RodA [Paenibacillaceae bacterium]|jgi:rod shape determining protein RodA|nr:rod shape-determining protein RodA [Paenibacillaceae bacterium]